MQQNNNLDNYIIHIKSCQTSNIKTLFEVLKDVLLTDVNLIFSKKCIKVVEMDSCQQAMVYLNLDSTAFEYYYINSNTDVVVGINTKHIFKIIKTSTSKDFISFIIKKDDIGSLYIKTEDENDKRYLESKIKILALDYTPLEIPSIEFQCEISLPSNKFQKNMKDLDSLCGDCEINITNVSNELVFSNCDEHSSNKIVFKESKLHTFTDKNNNDIIQGLFKLKYIILFTKATSLSTTVSIYLKNDYPLILEYSVGALGKLRFVLTNIDKTCV